MESRKEEKMINNKNKIIGNIVCLKAIRLYSVITLIAVLFMLLGGCVKTTENGIVITSYSIHYTKLYEKKKISWGDL